MLAVSAGRRASCGIVLTSSQALLRFLHSSPQCYGKTSPRKPPVAAPFQMVSPTAPVDPAILPDLPPTVPPRVRFAPSPTGALHLGGLRTALFNYLFAKKYGGTLILRIEDTDQTRLVPGSQESMQEMLQWAGLQWDEGPGISTGTKGPYVQSERLEIYKHYAEELIKQGKAYRDFRDQSQEPIDEDLELAMHFVADGSLKRQTAVKQDWVERRKLLKKLKGKQEYVPPQEEEAQRLIRANTAYCVRLKTEEADTMHHDGVFDRLLFKYDFGEPDPVLLKSDGWPTYHLASVVDDHLMGITHVLRGEEWLPSMPKHIALYNAFGFKRPTFLHLPLLMNKDRTKLSKKTKDVDIAEWRKTGYEAVAVLNWISLMGYNHHGEEQLQDTEGEGNAKEVFVLQDLVDSFDASRISRNRAVPSPPKLDFLNKRHLLLKCNGPASKSALSPEGKPINGRQELLQRILPALQEYFPQAASDGLLTDDYVAEVISQMVGRVTLLKDLPRQARYFFQDPNYKELLVGNLGWPGEPIARSDVRRYGIKVLARTLRQDHFFDFAYRVKGLLESLNEEQWKSQETLKSPIEDLLGQLHQEEIAREPGSLGGLDRVRMMRLLRLALFGGEPGPDAATMLHLLGRTRSLERIEEIIEVKKWWDPIDQEKTRLLEEEKLQDEKLARFHPGRRGR